MSRSKKPLPLLEGVTIEACAAEGKSLFHWNDMVVFVPFCVPGDVCDVQIRRKKHSFAEGEVVRFVEKSTIREEPMCQHFGVCGGCKWQNLPYAEQLKMKQKQIFDQLTRIGKIELPEFRTIMGSETIREYRNKLEFGCSNKRWLTKEQVATGVTFDNMNGIGFHITGAFDKILPIEQCHLMDPLQDEIRLFIRDYAFEHDLSFFDLRRQVGLLRDLIIRTSNSGEWMLIVQFGPEERELKEGQEGRAERYFDEPRAMELMEALKQRFPQISSLLWVYNPKCNDTIGDLDIQAYSGRDFMYEHMEDLRFKVGPKSFYQTNTRQALHLYEVAREFAGLTGSEFVYDLYTGTGTIANFVARRAKKVVGIEYVPEAIEDAKVNSQINGIDNTLFYAGDMKDILTDEFIQRHGRPDVIITDPPRAGMHPDVVGVILRAAPRRIVYVSCNPATQARDLQLLDVQYRVVAVQPVDMFPHTPHVENVVLLEQKVM